MKLAILGGDSRSRYSAKFLGQKGYAVSLWGIEPDASDVDTVRSDSVSSALQGAGALILPLPASDDGLHVRSAEKNMQPIRFRSLLTMLSPEVPIFGGKIPPQWIDEAEHQGHSVTDYFQSETLQMQNAVPTAEGAVLLALENLPVTLRGCEVAVVGYGRIGEYLAGHLQALGAKVTVFARKERDLRHAEIRGFRTASLEKRLVGLLSADCRMVFNTVPHRLVEKEEAVQFPKNCIWMELASPPGGMEPCLQGIPYLPAGGLPGRFFPETAGVILGQAIADELIKHGIFP